MRGGGKNNMFNTRMDPDLVVKRGKGATRLFMTKSHVQICAAGKYLSKTVVLNRKNGTMQLFTE